MPDVAKRESAAATARSHAATSWQPAAVAMPDAKWGETPCAFVELRTSAVGVTEHDIIAWTREQLAHFKCPRKVVFGELPKTSTGKIQKFVLRQKARSAAAIDT